MFTKISRKFPTRHGTTKKIIKAVKSRGRIGDRAINDYTLAKELGWTFDDIDNADPKRLNELFVVMNTLEKERKRQNNKSKRAAKHKR